ncbi:uncharacterized protein LOC144467960 [Augochlora pura]
MRDEEKKRKREGERIRSPFFRDQGKAVPTQFLKIILGPRWHSPEQGRRILMGSRASTGTEQMRIRHDARFLSDTKLHDNYLHCNNFYNNTQQAVIIVAHGHSWTRRTFETRRRGGTMMVLLFTTEFRPDL